MCEASVSVDSKEKEGLTVWMGQKHEAESAIGDQNARSGGSEHAGEPV